MFRQPPQEKGIRAPKCFGANVLSLSKGFTLVELLIVIAIIAIIASVVFVALNPLKRFQEARDSTRWSDVRNILSAINLYQVNNNGEHVYGVNFNTSASATVVDREYQIVGATTTANCNTDCPNVAASSYCVNLQGLVTSGYLGSLPISPTASTTAWTSTYTGYYMVKDSVGTITVTACSPENTSLISVTR
jgi:prepilin-type N-terminal cleavage/methylation domain-containing protein